MKRAFLFGFAVQLVLVAAALLVFDDLMPPMVRSPVIGVVALALGVLAALFAWRAPLHPGWMARIGMWIAGFLAIYMLIPVVEIVVVLAVAIVSN